MLCSHPRCMKSSQMYCYLSAVLWKGRHQKPEVLGILFLQGWPVLYAEIGAVLCMPMLNATYKCSG